MLHRRNDAVIWVLRALEAALKMQVIEEPDIWLRISQRVGSFELCMRKKIALDPECHLD